MRKPSRVGSRGRPRTTGVRRRTACRRRGAPPSVASAWLPVFFAAPAPFLLVPLLVLLFGGCSAGILGDDPETGLEVEVVRGPIEPVVREGEENTAPVEGATVEVRRSGGGRTRATTGAAGRARLALEPGRYTVEVEACPGALSLPPPADVTVEAGHLAVVRLECDTGIR